MGELTKRADRFVGQMLQRFRTLERRHPVEDAAVQRALSDRLRERRRSLRQYSVRGK